MRSLRSAVLGSLLFAVPWVLGCGGNDPTSKNMPAGRDPGEQPVKGTKVGKIRGAAD